MKPSELLSDPSKWCQGFSARKPNGIPTYNDDPEASSWCAATALTMCYKDPIEMWGAAKKLHSVGMCSELPISVWNDDPKRTFEEVRDAFLKAGL